MIAATTLPTLAAARVGCRVLMLVGALAVGLGSTHLGAGQPASKHQGRLCQHCGGNCGPHCPVRPGLYGFYGTQWRPWPGQGFMSSREAGVTTPAQPPRTAVPGPDEESLQPRSEVIVPQADSDPPRAEEVPPRAEDGFVPLPEPEKPAKPKEPEKLDEFEAAPPASEEELLETPSPPDAPAPLPLPPSTNSQDDENIFNSRYRPKSMKKLPMSLGGTKSHAHQGNVQPTSLLKSVNLKRVPRVAFDPENEARELRIRTE